MAVILRVETVQHYEISRVLSGNGWTTEQLIADWFEEGRINISHVTRDNSEIGNTRIFISAEVIDASELFDAFLPGPKGD